MVLELSKKHPSLRLAAWARPMQPIQRGLGRPAFATWSLVIALTIVMCVQITVGQTQLRMMVEELSLRSDTWSWADIPGYSRMLTYTLLHADAPHFFWNTILILLVGVAVENRTGLRVVGVLFIASAIIAGLTHLLMFPGETRPLVGASGIGSALFGTIMVVAGNVGFNVRIPRTSRWVGLTLRRVILAWVVIQIIGLIVVYVSPGSPSQVAYWSHLSGFAAGVAGGYAFEFWGASSTESEPDRTLAHSFGSAGD